MTYQFIKRLKLLLMIFVTLSWLAAGCFNIRPVEPPQTGSSDWISPTDYQILLTNWQTAVSQRNTQNYLRCFNQDSLRFIPDSEVLNNNEAIWLNWSIQDEQAYFDNVMADLSVPTGNSLSLNEVSLQDVTSDSLKYIGTYLLRLNHQNEALPTLFQGQLQLLIKRNEFNEWEIHRWADIALAQDSSWSELKLGFIQ